MAKAHSPDSMVVDDRGVELVNFGLLGEIQRKEIRVDHVELQMRCAGRTFFAVLGGLLAPRRGEGDEWLCSVFEASRKIVGPAGLDASKDTERAKPPASKTGRRHIRSVRIRSRWTEDREFLSVEQGVIAAMLAVREHTIGRQPPSLG